MPVVRSFTRGQWEALGRRLDALPEKATSDQPLKVSDGVKSIQKQIGTARERGYTLSELIEEAAQEGIAVSVNSLRYAMRRADGKGRIRRGGNEPARANASVAVRGRKPSQADATHDKPPRSGTQQKGDGGVTRPGQPVRGFLGFSISPDTENL
ncbi:hypothetical protein [Paraburkholderia youngii]|uniref:hypothetical protein n=1 Tax=Paraburkholderia youngii TaxID=2782701 RepID=UPI003D25E8CA